MHLSLIHVFSPSTDSSLPAAELRQTLLAYAAALRQQSITHTLLNPFFESCTESTHSGVDTRASAFKVLYTHTPMNLVHLSLFLVPAILHMPAYISCMLMDRLIFKTMPEQIANVKIQYSFFMQLFFIYPALCYLAWSVWSPSIPVFIATLLFLPLISYLHYKRIDSAYASWKTVHAVWKIATKLCFAKLSKKRSEVDRLLQLRDQAVESLLGALHASTEGDQLTATSVNARCTVTPREAHSFSPELFDWYRSCGAKLLETRKQVTYYNKRVMK